ncbi:ABATE domain-containing protein [Pseudoxanthomonas sp. PXM02]|uniref:CGNR zinc finger domain-containing protein n=1 Tax=Pseudoxanthomonas sp. PXM02 TaxID=2769294 RepID=UPI001780ADD2|nr:ABATE domain-containing protein [Pseudoxanthomonas sp. PXM02]MBD9477910.1 ABATE domain-containing protein [Pseudoxanthomonas sp. PXM02]
MGAVELRAANGITDAPQVGDHLALDLLNTEARSQGLTVDHWTTPEDVCRWLARQGVLPADPVGPVPADLLMRGRELRTAVREAIAARKAGEPVGIEGLNTYLQAYVTAPLLQRDDTGAVTLARVARGDGAVSMLGPVAEAAAHLLAEGDFALVRQCEHPDCILWFYDRTKSHKRRWCSMAQCGNRHKAAQFRKRSSAE